MEPRQAGFWVRAIAFALDLLVLNVLLVVLLMAGQRGMYAGLANLDLNFPSQELMLILFELYGWVSILLFFGYFAFFQAFGGQTPAKRLLKLRVVSRDRRPLGWPRAMLRTLGYFISGPFLMGLGFLIAAFHPRKLALHDLLAGTEVIHDLS